MEVCTLLFSYFVSGGRDGETLTLIPAVFFLFIYIGLKIESSYIQLEAVTQRFGCKTTLQANEEEDEVCPAEYMTADKDSMFSPVN